MNCDELNYLFVLPIVFGLISMLFHRHWGRKAIRHHNRMSQSKYLGWMYGYKIYIEKDERIMAWGYLIMGLLFVLLGVLGLFKVIG